MIHFSNLIMPVSFYIQTNHRLAICTIYYSLVNPSYRLPSQY